MRFRVQRILVVAALITATACTAEPSEAGDQANGGVGGGASGGTGAVAGAGTAGMVMNAGGMASVAGSAGVGDVVASGGMGAVDSGGVGSAPMGGSGGTGQAGSGGMPGGDQCKVEGAFEPLVPRDGETCYEFLMHDGDGTTPFMVPEEESYNEFFFEIPWGADEVATRFGQILDNKAVLHHWLGFTTTDGAPGQIDRLVTGTQLGESATLFGGWASGGCNVEFPPDMGLALEDPGKQVMFQWHHYNFTGMPQPDSTKIQICTVPTAMRKNIGSVTWLGTEDLGGNAFLGGGMPPGVESKFGGTCLNETAEPITIVSFLPHMHRIGKNMYTEVIRADGAVETVFDEPFSNDYQAYYALSEFVTLMPGDKIRAECTFFNNTQGNVPFGQSTDQEMCYQFAFSYPAGALDKPGNFSLIGATNTCWGD